MSGGRSIEQARRENREHARVRIRQRLTRAEDVEEPGGDRRHPIRLPDHQAQTFLVELRERVDRLQRRRLRLGRRHRLERRAVRVELPLVRRSSCSMRSLGVVHEQAVGGRDTVPRHRCSCSRRRPAVRPAARSSAPAASTCRRRWSMCSRRSRYMLWPTPTSRREMDHRVDTFERARDAVRIPDVADDRAPLHHPDTTGARVCREPAGRDCRARARDNRRSAARRRDASR